MSFSLAFAGVGAARSGTSWLASVLATHPDLFIPSEKELHYFGDDRRYTPSLAGYRDFFRGAPADALLGEFTPRYTIQPKALERLAAHFPSLRVILCLREPVARAYSQFMYFRSNKGKERIGDFQAALDGPFYEDYIVKSLYTTQLRRLYSLFGRERVHLVWFDEMVTQPAASVRGILAFLGVRSELALDTGGGRRNESLRFNADFVAWLRRRQNDLRPCHAAPWRRYGATLCDYAIRGVAKVKGEADARLPESARAAIFDAYFRADVETMESEFGLDLTGWRPRA